MAKVVKGRVKRLYVRDGRVWVRVDIPASEQPKENEFRLDQTHGNYNALYSLALSAAINGHRLQIKTVDEITAGSIAVVDYMVVDY
jgi:hypothetical protein